MRCQRHRDAGKKEVKFLKKLFDGSAKRAKLSIPHVSGNPRERFGSSTSGTSNWLSFVLALKQRSGHSSPRFKAGDRLSFFVARKCGRTLIFDSLVLDMSQQLDLLARDGERVRWMKAFAPVRSSLSSLISHFKLEMGNWKEGGGSETR
jgi:hypothetical protein